MQSPQQLHTAFVELAKHPPSTLDAVDDGIRVLRRLLTECSHLYPSPLAPHRIAKAVMGQMLQQGLLDCAVRWGQQAIATLTIVRRMSATRRGAASTEMLDVSFRTLSFVATGQMADALLQTAEGTALLTDFAVDSAAALVGFAESYEGMDDSKAPESGSVIQLTGYWLDSCYRTMFAANKNSFASLVVMGEVLSRKQIPQLLAAMPLRAVPSLLHEPVNGCRRDKLVAVARQLVASAHSALTSATFPRSPVAPSAVLAWIQDLRGCRSGLHVPLPVTIQISSLLSSLEDANVARDSVSVKAAAEEGTRVQNALTMVSSAVALLASVLAHDPPRKAVGEMSSFLEAAAGAAGLALFAHRLSESAVTAAADVVISLADAAVAVDAEQLAGRAAGHILCALAGMVTHQSSSDIVNTSAMRLAAKAYSIARGPSVADRERRLLTAVVRSLTGAADEGATRRSAEASVIELIQWQTEHCWEEGPASDLRSTTLHERSATKVHVGRSQLLLPAAVTVGWGFAPVSNASGAITRLLLPAVYSHLMRRAFVAEDTQPAPSFVVSALLRKSIALLIFDLVRCGELHLALPLSLWPLALAASHNASVSPQELAAAVAVFGVVVSQIPATKTDGREFRRRMASFACDALPTDHFLGLLLKRSTAMSVGLYGHVRELGEAGSFGMGFIARRKWCSLAPVLTVAAVDPTDDQLPHGCVLIELHLDSAKAHLRLIRRARRQQPFAFVLSAVSDHHNVLLECLDRMRHIDCASQQHMLSRADAAPTDDKRAAKTRWWQTRQTLNDDIEQVIGVLSEQLLAPWAPLLVGPLQGRDPADSDDIQRQVSAVARQATSRLQRCASGKSVHEAPVSALLHGLPFAAATVRRPKPVIVEGLGPRATLTPAEFCARLDARQLECVEGLAAAFAALVGEAGAAGDAFLRAVEADSDGIEAAAAAAARDMFHILSSEKVLLPDGPLVPQGECCRRSHVYLALDNALHGLPWETLPALRTQSVSRVPNAQFVCDAFRQANEVTVDAKRVRYELNPTGDMKASEERFAELFARHWYGRVRSCCTTDDAGRCVPLPLPSTKDSCSFLRALSRDDVYVYVGHSTGERLVGRHVLYDACTGPDGLPLRMPVALLMGCSSARMAAGPTHDPWGMPLAYLHAGSPAVVGCLWDVTDGEVDKLTLAMLRSFMPSIEVPSGEHRTISGSASLPLPLAVAASRHSCKFLYLTGGAVVVYGVPVTCGAR
jgi:hypothetical protein